MNDEVTASGGETTWCDGPEGLGALWQWFDGRLREAGPTGLVPAAPLPAADPQAGARPPWHSPDQPNPYLSDGALWLIEGLGCHLATLAMCSHQGAGWEVYRPSNRRDVNFNRTRLVGVPGGPADPAQMIYGAVVRTVIHSQPWEPGELSRLFHYLVDPLG